jgi:hypothetical protein
MKYVLMVFGLLAAASVFRGQENFDRLDPADRSAFAKRFEKEIWPLLVRRGKDGCVGCHHPKVENNALRFVGEPATDFARLLKEGLFLQDDSGSILARVSSKKADTRMPPGARPAWTADEIKLLRDFMLDVDKKQKKK